MSLGRRALFIKETMGEEKVAREISRF